MSRFLTIVHTNDLHGALENGAADRLRDLIAASEEPLLLDAGDAIRAGNLGWPLPGRERMLPLLSQLGYHAMTLGNRETHPRRAIFPLKVKGARFPLLCANIIAKNGAPLPTRPWLIREHAGVRVGIFGVSVPMFSRKQWTQCLCDYWFDRPVEAARAAARELRPQVDVLIALTHIGLRHDRLLAEAAPEVDLILGGHSHSLLEQPEVVAGVPILQARAHAYAAGRARLRVDNGKVRLASWEQLPLRVAPPRRTARPAEVAVR